MCFDRAPEERLASGSRGQVICGCPIALHNPSVPFINNDTLLNSKIHYTTEAIEPTANGSIFILIH